APPSKHSQTKSTSHSGLVQDGTTAEGSAKESKYKNSDLPPGAITGNKWCSVLVPTYAKWNSMLNICWGTKNSQEIEVLQLLWDVVYKHTIPAMIQGDDPIYTTATQRITEWQGGFMSASISMIHSLINSDERFSSPQGQCGLANFRLEGNQMWKSPFILQTFAAHIHFIQGAMDIPINTGLKDRHGYPKAALSLAGAAACIQITSFL
ncbi:hypothetical protein PAXRUDRAFT_798024, partial [Paxillus rubicundulus Ve08.2h10]